MNAKDPFVEIAAGNAIFREGEPGHEMYIIESGTVEIVRQARGSDPLATLESGDCFGEMALLEEQPRFATALAKTNVRLLRIERAVFADVMRSNVEIPIRIMKKLAGRLRRSEERAHDAKTALDDFKRKLSQRRDEGRAETPTAPPPPRADPAVAFGAALAPPTAAPAAASAPDAAPAPAVAPVTAPPVPPAPVARNWQLVHHDSGNRFALAGAGEYLVGRPDPVSGINPEINLGPFDTARSLSRRHAKIVVEDGRCLVREDTATTNGTFVNGERLTTGTPVDLKPGDRVKFGSVEVEVVA